MSTDVVKLLCAGDLHLGRRPPAVRNGPEPRLYSPEVAWRHLVAKAIEQKVDAVLLAGDVVDQDNRFFEAVAPLDEGVRRLVDQGVQVYAVSGNHDHEVLPRLSAEIDGFHLLGAAGTWEEVFLEKDGRPALRLVGWSFPSRHFHSDPMQTFPWRAQHDLPTVGLLHCDLGVTGSSYAPVSKTDLERAPVDAWILGHVHVPSDKPPQSPLILYTGSLQGLDPTETGPRGGWLVSCHPRKRIEWKKLPLAALQWESVDLPTEGIEGKEQWESTIYRTLLTRLQQVSKSVEMVSHVACRLRLTGRTSVHHQFHAWRAELLERFVPPEHAGVRLYLEGVRDTSLPAVDLKDLARGQDPPGILAGLLLQLESGESRELVARFEERLRPVLQRAEYLDVSKEYPPGPETATEIAREACWIAIEELLAQAERLR